MIYGLGREKTAVLLLLSSPQTCVLVLSTFILFLSSAPSEADCPAALTSFQIGQTR